MPNTIVAWWAGDGGVQGQNCVGWRKDRMYLSDLGFDVISLSIDSGEGCDTFKTAVADYSGAGQLYGLFAMRTVEPTGLRSAPAAGWNTPISRVPWPTTSA